FPQAREGAARAVRASLARGYGLTVTGLRRFIEPGDDRARNQMRNHPIQGGAAAIFKTALARIGGYLPRTQTQLLLPRHDSILLLTPEGTEEEVVATCRVIMVQAVREKYPELSPRWTRRWGTAGPRSCGWRTSLPGNVNERLKVKTTGRRGATTLPGPGSPNWWASAGKKSPNLYLDSHFLFWMEGPMCYRSEKEQNPRPHVSAARTHDPYQAALSDLIDVVADRQWFDDHPGTSKRQ